jgi:hypothetical protein
MMGKLICGVGWNDGKYRVFTEEGKTACYRVWTGLLERSYCLKVQEKQPTYRGCSVSENFKSYSYFHEWCLRQVGFGQKGFQLDKDLLIKGNKIYSEETCLFLPQEINKLLTKREACRGDLPIGVTVRLKGNRFSAQGTFGSYHKKHLGFFDSAEKAFLRYKQVKEAYIKLKAEQWKTFIEPRAYLALMSYEILITD